MNLLTLLRRSLTHHWRAHLAVALGVAAGAAVLTGALLVGDSLRGSLRAAALDRLASVDYTVQSPTFFRATLAVEIGSDADFRRTFAYARPAILEHGSATHAGSHATAHDVTVQGWPSEPLTPRPGTPEGAAGRPEKRLVSLNQALADDLGARRGDDVLLRLAKPSALSPETLFGRRDDAVSTLRLTVQDVHSTGILASFTLNTRPTLPRIAWVRLSTLQRALGQPDRVNTIAVSARPGVSVTAPETAAALQALLQRHATVADLGLRLRASEEHQYIALESEAFLLAPPVEAATRAAATAMGVDTTAVLTYLANTIAVESRPAAMIPYSTVAAIAPAREWLNAVTLTTDGAAPALASGEILLNEWAASGFGAVPGDVIRLTYYVTGPFGRLETQDATFRLRRIVRMTGAAADPGLVPEYPGVTDAKSLADWNPPFPIDLTKVRPQDETYWREYRATPKAFITLADGQRLWAGDHERFGGLTSLRIYPLAGQSLGDAGAAFERELMRCLDVSQLGLRVDAVRARALAASQGTTDFAGLFVGFSFFLIVSTAMLVALLFRLNVERRAHEVGLLLATGFPRWRVGCQLLAEGALTAAIGAGIGLLAARGYAWLMLAGLRSWWSAAIGASGSTGTASFLHLHAAPTSYLIGYMISVVIAIVSIAWSLRGLTRFPPRALLAGPLPQGPARRLGRTRPRRVALGVAFAAAAAAGVLIALSLVTSRVPPTTAFFVGGTGLLVAGLAALVHWLGAAPHARRPMHGAGLQASLRGPVALVRLGLRNARRNRLRSLLTAGLIAAATFVITALQAMRLDAPANVRARTSGTGGCTLMAETDVSITADLNTAAGRSALGFSDTAKDGLAGVTFFPFRVHAGDEASCLNLYQPVEPRILGVTDALIERGGFTFTASVAQTPEERANPWMLLRRELPNGIVPAIADEAAALWQLHAKLGGDVVVTDERGRAVRLRLVALLKNSILQGELVVGEPQFTRLFPSISGYAFYLIETPDGRAAPVQERLQRELADYGCAVMPAARRLAELFAVQNTYLATFQTLGGLGLLLGTVGLAVVLLRNVWERRGELALLRMLGFSRAALGTIVLSENAFLVVTGLVTGLVSAAVVAMPHVLMRGTPLPWVSLLLMFTLILVSGLLAGLIALIPTLRAPLLSALRSE